MALGSVFTMSGCAGAKRGATDVPSAPGPAPGAARTAAPLAEPGDVRLQVVHDREDVAFRFSWKSHPKRHPPGFANVGRIYPGQFHDLLRFVGDAFDSFPEGPERETRFEEDRVTFMLQDPARPVAGFAAAGCFVACHAGMKSHHLLPGAGSFLDHWHWRGARSGPMGYAEDAWVSNAQRERDSAGSPPSQWLRAGGDRLREDQAALARTGHPKAEGMPRFVFARGKRMPAGFVVPAHFVAREDGSLLLDPYAGIPQVRDVGPNRSLLVVHQDRTFDPVDKVNAIDLGYLVHVARGTTEHLPAHLRDVAGAPFRTWRAFWAEELGIPADPGEASAVAAAEARLDAIHAEWEGSARRAMVARSVGFIHRSDQHDITSSRSFDAQAGVWTVTLHRRLSTGRTNDADLAGLATGTEYDLAFALHDVGDGDETHHISLPHRIGKTRTADVPVTEVADVRATDWAAVPAVLARVFQPGTARLDELKDSARHPGAESVGVTRCQECHRPEELRALGR
jgi:hypothetical protein